MSWRQDALRRSEKAMHCRTLMRGFKQLAPLPKLAPPPKEFTKEQWRISRGAWERVKHGR